MIETDISWMFIIWLPAAILFVSFILTVVYAPSFVSFILTAACAVLGIIGLTMTGAAGLYADKVRIARLSDFNDLVRNGETFTPDMMSWDASMSVLNTQIDVMQAQSTLLFFVAMTCFVTAIVKEVASRLINRSRRDRAAC